VGRDRVAESGTLTLPKPLWAEAKRRAAIIAPLAAADLVPAAMARAAGETLGLSERTVYDLVRRYRRSGGLLASLAPQASPGGRGKTRLPRLAEQIIAEAIRDEYLTRQKKRAEAVVRTARERARAAGIAPPSPNTVRARVRAVRADLAARRREGSRSSAWRRLEPVTGMTPAPERPMAVLQIDHTPVDLVLVDEASRQPIGRPWLTVAIDVMSRCVAGFLVSFDPPGATSVGLCLAHAALPKAAYLARLGIQGLDWPVDGKPGRLYVDNGAEFHSAALSRGCEQHGIVLDYRPVATPHFGGIIERLIGTLMTMVHELPGTTFSNPIERGDYDSDTTACLTLAELESWLALAIAGRYHHEVHDGIEEPPLARWRRGVAAFGAPPAVADPSVFLIDFLPVLCRKVTREGIRIDHITYYSDALRPWIAARDSLGSFVIRRDPRDLSRIFVLDPEDGTYVEAPCARQERPSISLFEHRQAVAQLKAAGRAQVDEEAIFQAVAQQREIAQGAAMRSRAARRRLARIRRLSLDPVAPRTVPAITSAPDPSDDDVFPVTRLYPVTRW
jgi:putative transposase